jgi:hypothetical protein
MAGTWTLKPYERRREPGPIRKFVAFSGLLFLAAFYGLMCSILPMQLLFVPLVPVLLMFGAILWLLPDTGGIQYDLMARLMVFYAGLNVLWPFYVAIDAPGLPWITPARIAVGLLAAVVLLNLATSSEFRSSINDTLKAAPDTRKLFWFYWGVTVFALFFSVSPMSTLTKFINNQIYWIMMFSIAALLAARAGFVMRVSRVLAWSIVIVSMLGLYEAAIQQVFWMSRLPSFLKVDPILLATYGEAQNRAGTDVYRVRGTMGVSLYYAEYLALVFPLVLHFACRQKTFLMTTLVSLGVVAVAINMYLTNARSAIIGLLIAVVGYAFFTAYRARKRHPNSIVAAAGFFSFPAAVGVLIVLMLSWTRLRTMTLGGGQHQPSSEARRVQWEMGLPKVLERPFGHGPSQSGEVLGYFNLAGEMTIDTYYLSLLLDYGPLGLVAFILLLSSVVWLGFKLFRDADTPEQELSGPLALGVLNILIVKSVSSVELNLPVAFMMSGCIVGLAWQQAKARAPAAAALDADTEPLRTSMTPGSAAPA